MQASLLLRRSRTGKSCARFTPKALAAICCILYVSSLHAQVQEEPESEKNKPVPSAVQPRASSEPSSEVPLPDSAGQSLHPDENSITGLITDRSGALVSGCRIVLVLHDHFVQRSTVSGSDGSFSFRGVPPGAFTMTVTRDGYMMRTITGNIQTEESLDLPQVVLGVAGSAANVQVFASTHDIAVEQVRLEEKQRVLGIFPNFYISYIPHPVPLSSRQKFQLAARSTIDPVNLALVGVTAAIEQAADTFPGYGQGASGFGKRYGAGFADGAISTTIGGAILPSLLHQDPRYFWKGQGTKMQRARYAVTRIVICKGDNGRWQFNYSSIFGNLASAGLSNLYYPASDRNGAGLTISNALIGTASGAIANLYQEFFSRRMTPSASRIPLPSDAR